MSNHNLSHGTQDFKPLVTEMAAECCNQGVTSVDPIACSQTVSFLHNLWHGGSYAYYWNGDTKQSFWFPVDTIEALPNGWRDNNVYFGVHPTSAIPTHNAQGQPVAPIRARSRLENIATVNCLYADFDAKNEVTAADLITHIERDHDDIQGGEAPLSPEPVGAEFLRSPDTYKQRALTRIEQLPLQPTYIVDSGGGYHGYWLLADTITLDDGYRQQLARLQGDWVRHVGGDESAKDLARVLRLPGTWNMKSMYEPLRPQVHFVVAEDSRQYCLEDFERLLQENEGRARTEPHRTLGAPSAGSNVDSLNKARVNLERLQQWRVDDYDSWIKVGMSLRELGDAGLRLWIEWSQRSTKFEPGECERKWRTFGPSGGLSLGSLMFWANQDDPDGHRLTQHLPINTNFGALGENQLMVVQNHVEEPLAVAAPDVMRYRPEDGGILDSWHDLFGSQWVYSSGFGAWYKWTGTHWDKDDTQDLKNQVLQQTDDLNQQAYLYFQLAQQCREPEHIKRARQWINATKRTGTRMNSVEKMAQTRCDHRASEFDAGNLLNLCNGTLDLDKMRLRDHSRHDLLTYALEYAYDSSADCPRWKQFVEEVFVKEGTTEADLALIHLVQELIGYSLTNDTSQEVMMWLYGAGGNGKTVLLETIRGLLGPLVVSVNFHEIGKSGNYDLARLAGKRVAMSAESERKGTLSEGCIKQIVSGETIGGRAIYGSPFDFEPTAKIWWAMNHLPRLEDTSGAMWRRLKLVPFNRAFDNQARDPDLRNRLRGELPGILNWALDGLKRLRKQGQFTESVAVSATMADYKQSANPVACWLAEASSRLEEIAAKEAYQDYCEWCIREGGQPISNTMLGKRLKQLGVPSTRRSYGKVYIFNATSMSV